MFFESDDIGEKVPARQCKDLHNKIQAFIRVFDERNQKVSDLIDELRQDDFTDIIPQLLERQTSLAVE